MSNAPDMHEGHGAAHAGPHHGPRYYVISWAILLVLLCVSIVGPMLGIKIVTLITAFGIAIVKAWMVAARFMHLNIEKKYVTLLLMTMIGALLIFWFAVAPDVMKHEGTNWENVSAKEHKESTAGEHGAEHH